MAYPNVKYKTFTDIVDKDGGDVISYLDSSSTIDFNNKNVINFTGSGSGGGDAVLSATQTFSGINTFTNNTILAGVTSGAITSSGVITGSSLETTGNVECNKVECVGNVEVATGNLVVTLGTGSFGGQIVGNSGLSITSGTTSVEALTTNNITTTGTITASAEIQGSSLAAAGGNINCPGGNINGLSIQSTGGQVNLKT